MSEQTPEAAMDASEPSMEDILASIRKIIADDDAPETSAVDTSIDTMDIGNVSDLVSDQEQIQAPIIDPPNLDLESEFQTDTQFESALQNVDLSDDLVVEDPELLMGEAGDVVQNLADIAPNDAAPSTDVTSHLRDNSSALAAPDSLSWGAQRMMPKAALSLEDETQEADLGEIGLDVVATEALMPDDVKIDETLSEDIAAPDNFLDHDNLINFDMDADLADMVDLEIPMPDPNEALIGHSSADELITRPGVPDDNAPKLGGLAGGAATLGAVTAGAAKAVKTEMRADTDPAIIDDELTALLDEDILVAEPSDLSADDLSIVEDNAPDIADTLSSDMDALDDSLDVDLNAALDIEDSPATGIETTDLDASDIETPKDSFVTDDELDALLADMDLEQDGLETSDAAQEVGSEEDADLLLVKSLMADLADYDTDSELVTDEVTPLDVTPSDSDELPSTDNMTEPAADIMDAPSLSDIPNDIEADDDAILDEILDLALEDELQSAAELDTMGADDVAALEFENLAENAKLDALLSDVPFDDLSALGIEDAVSDMPSAMPDEMPADNGAMSLSDIAAAAQADADAAETVSAVQHSGLGAILAGVGGAAIAGGAAVMAQADEAKIDASEIDISDIDISEIDALALTQFEGSDVQTDNSVSDDVEQMLSKLLDDEVSTASEDLNDDIPEDERFDLEGFAPNSNIEENLTHDVRQEATDAPESHKLQETTQEITDMPRAAAKNTDIIMDDVTETATASVFAELNQVVEEKAIVAERGDRIGDLVMEALRPMLKDWLDANLKGIVERAVAKEVKRISSGK